MAPADLSGVAGSTPAAASLPPVSLVQRNDTWRLIPSRFADVEESVLAPLARDDAQLQQLFELDNATNSRLLGEQGRLCGIGVDELVFGVPLFRMVNAAFTYPRPEGSRFNSGLRGAWYCAFDADAALAEIVFHKTLEYREIALFNDTVRYQALVADFNAEFHDLRPAHGPKRAVAAIAGAYAACLDPLSYIASQALAETLLEVGSMGIVYPSVRCPGGTNLACFRPALVSRARKGPAYRLTWNGAPEPVVEVITGPSAQAAI